MAIHDYGVYWMYAGVCAINALFCIFFVYETKGKKIEEILCHYGAPALSKESKVKEKGYDNLSFIF